MKWVSGNHAESKDVKHGEGVESSIVTDCVSLTEMWE
jgi:hypothetical protein